MAVSPRESQILELISKGIIAKNIAKKLNISLNTVITHRKNLLSKFNVRNTAEMISKAAKIMLI
jgi:DNA-binding CsgD family transcriptional regulator